MLTPQEVTKKEGAPISCPSDTLTIWQGITGDVLYYVCTTPHNPIVASDAHIKADKTEAIDIVLVSGCLNPGTPNDKLSKANIIIVIGRP